MRYFWVAIFILAWMPADLIACGDDAPPPAERVERPEKKKFGPILIAKGDDYTIHGFFGSITPPRERFESVVTPGVVLFRTNTETSEAAIVMTTGTYAFPTRRASFQHRRLVGTLVTDRMIYTAVYFHTTFDAPPGDPGADDRRPGSYVLNVYDLASGQFLTRHIPVEHTTHLPKEVPGETLDEGAILPTEGGLSIFGAKFIIKEDGRLKAIKPDGEAEEEEIWDRF